MSIQGEIDRINNNVSDALAATAEMGASVPETANSNDLGRLIRSIPQSGGGTSINVTAEVGQTIVVKAVDENGKPTAWESADYQPRTHWTEIAMAELLPETTIVIYPETGQGPYMKTIGLLTGRDYLVRWNGTEYNCTAQDMYMPIDDEGNIAYAGVAVGDVGMMMGEEGTGEPFLILEFSSELAAMVGGIPVAVSSFDGSESVTVSIVGEGEIVHTIPQGYVPYALPYYIDLSFATNGDGTIASATCNETVSRLEAMYRSGRTLVLRFKTQEASSDGQGNPITNIYEYRWQLATSASTPLLPGTTFQFADPYVKQNSGGNYVTSAITLTPNKDGTYDVTGVFMN